MRVSGKICLRGLVGLVGVVMAIAVVRILLIAFLLPCKLEIGVEVPDKTVPLNIVADDQRNPWGRSAQDLFEMESDCAETVLRTYFRRPFNVENFDLILKSTGVEQARVKWARISIDDLVKRDLIVEGGDFGAVVHPGQNRRFHIGPGGSRWSRWGIWSDGAGVSVLLVALRTLALPLLLIAFVIAYFSRNCGNKHWLLNSAVLAGIWTLFAFLVLPLQGYLGNSSDYPFGWFDVVCNQLLVCLAVVPVVFLILAMIRYGFGPVALFAVWGLLVFEYLQTGILTADEPFFKGDATYYLAADKVLLHNCVAAVCVLGAVACYPVLKRYFLWMCGALTVMLAASLCDVRGDARNYGLERSADAGYCELDDVPGRVRFSAKRNVVFLVIDSVSSEVFEDVLKEDSGLAAAFDGFTQFADNVGPWAMTIVATPGFFTGDVYMNNNGRKNYASSAVCEKRSA